MKYISKKNLLFVAMVAAISIIFCVWNNTYYVYSNVVDTKNIETYEVNMQQRRQYNHDKVIYDEQGREQVVLSPLIDEKNKAIDNVIIKGKTGFEYLYLKDDKEPVYNELTKDKKIKVNSNQEVVVAYLSATQVFIVGDITINGQLMSTSIYNTTQKTITNSSGIFALTSADEIKINNTPLTLKQLDQAAVLYYDFYLAASGKTQEEKVDDTAKVVEEKTSEADQTIDNSSQKNQRLFSKNTNNTTTSVDNGTGSNQVVISKIKPVIKEFTVNTNQDDSYVELNWLIDSGDYNVDKIEIYEDYNKIGEVDCNTTTFRVDDSFGSHKYLIKVVYDEGLIVSNTINTYLDADIMVGTVNHQSTTDSISFTKIIFKDSRHLKDITTGNINLVAKNNPSDVHSIALTDDQIDEVKKGSLSGIEFLGLTSDQNYILTFDFYDVDGENYLFQWMM